MSEEFSPEVTSDDKLWVLLTYVFSPIIPIILMFMEDKKDRPFIRSHNAQALVAGLIIIVLTPLTLGCGSVFWLVMFYWAYKGYQGERIEIPVISNFVRTQGWA